MIKCINCLPNVLSDYSLELQIKLAYLGNLAPPGWSFLRAGAIIPHPYLRCETQAHIDESLGIQTALRITILFSEK